MQIERSVLELSETPRRDIDGERVALQEQTDVLDECVDRSSGPGTTG